MTMVVTIVSSRAIVNQSKTLDAFESAGGDKIPRKGGLGITRSDLLVINKTDFAPHVGTSLEVMDRDDKKCAANAPSCLQT